MSDGEQVDGVAPAGWYQDPSVPGVTRYFDGVRWTEHTVPEDITPLVERFERRQRRYRVVRRPLEWLMVVVLGVLVVLAPNPTNCPRVPERDRVVCQSLVDGVFVVPGWLNVVNAWLWLVALVLVVVVLLWREPRALSQAQPSRTGRQVAFLGVVVVVLVCVLFAGFLSALTSLGSAW